MLSRFCSFSMPSSVSDTDLRFSSSDVVLVRHQAGDDLVDPVVLVGGVLGGAADDERRARLVDEDGVHLVDDGEVQLALDVVLQPELHVVAQVVEAELVVLPVGDVRAVGLLALLVGQLVEDAARGHAQEAGARGPSTRRRGGRGSRSP